MGKRNKKLKVNKKSSMILKETDSADKIKEKFYKLKNDYDILKKKCDKLTKENKMLKVKVLHVKTGLLKKYEEDMEHEFNNAQKNKFLYNIDPPTNVENKSLSCSDEDNILDDGATDGENFRNLMEYQ